MNVLTLSQMKRGSQEASYTIDVTTDSTVSVVWLAIFSLSLFLFLLFFQILGPDQENTCHKGQVVLSAGDVDIGDGNVDYQF